MTYGCKYCCIAFTLKCPIIFAFLGVYVCICVWEKRIEREREMRDREKKAETERREQTVFGCLWSFDMSTNSGIWTWVLLIKGHMSSRLPWDSAATTTSDQTMKLLMPDKWYFCLPKPFFFLSLHLTTPAFVSFLIPWVLAELLKTVPQERDHLLPTPHRLLVIFYMLSIK